MDADNALPSVPELTFILAKVFQSIPIYFAHWEDSRLQKAQLDGAFRELVPAVMSAKTRTEFSLLMMRFLAQLNNGHTGFWDLRLIRKPSLGFNMRFIDEGWVVTASKLPELRVGDLVTHFEGRNLSDWYHELAEYAGGNDRAKQMRFAGLLRCFLPAEYQLGFTNSDGTAQALVCNRVYSPSASDKVATSGEWLEDGRIAYIKVPSFNHPDFENAALDCISRYAQAHCLIVDVRGNTGGSTPGKLVRRLMNRPYRWWTESSPLNVGILSYQAANKGPYSYMFNDANLLWRPSYHEPEAGAYDGDVIILVDYRTGSAAEDFVVPFKDNGRATIVGEMTSGSTGQPYRYDFGNDMAFQIGTKRAYMPDGSKFEGVGIAPDIHVRLERSALYAGTDPVLEKAIELVNKP